MGPERHSSASQVDPDLADAVRSNASEEERESLAVLEEALLESVVKTHPFVDGTKRVAFAGTGAAR